LLNLLNSWLTLARLFIWKYLNRPSRFRDKLLQLEDFLKECGIVTENLPKFSIKKEDILEDQSTKIIVLEKK